MTRFSMIALAAACCIVALALSQPTTKSRAATPPPTPVVSVTTLPALPSPGTATVHPATSIPQPQVTPGTAPSTAAMPPAGPGQPAMPPPGTFILVNGAVSTPMYVTLDQLQKMRSTSITLKIAGHGIVTVTGAPLDAVINLAQPTVTGGTNNSPIAYAFVTGVSSQSATVAFPEFEKAFEGKIVLLAYLINGKPPKAGAATLVVQGDATAGRFIEGVSHIQVVQPTPSQ